MSVGSNVIVAPELAGLRDGGVAVRDREADAPVGRDLGGELLVGHLHHASDRIAVALPHDVLSGAPSNDGRPATQPKTAR
jgi:hypothetical protein